MSSFADQTVLVTGVGRAGQLGEALGLAFAEGGARVALVGRAGAEVEARAAALRARGHEARAFACDLTDPASTGAAFAAVRGAFGPRLDALVCAAGGFAATGALDAEADGAAALRALEGQLALNLTTAYVATRAALPMLRAEGGGGAAARVVYVASAAALPDGDAAGLAAYAASKAGVLALMRAVAADERPGRGAGAGVRANAVAPGAIRTAANVAAAGDAGGLVAREAVAEAAAWLASAASAPVTGQVLRVD
jgi:NAD(P)-dependent dehydrogenase (short-subunit alcohol dehydrogenase family)